MQDDAKTKVFWPKNCMDAPSGYLVGWNVCSFVGCVAAVVANKPLAELEAELLRLGSLPQYVDLFRYSFGPPIVLGSWHNPRHPSRLNASSERDDVQRKKYTANLWISMQLNDQSNSASIKTSSSSSSSFHNDDDVWPQLLTMNPSVVEVLCYGYLYRAVSTVIYYEQRSPLHYYSNEALNVDVSNFPIDFADDESIGSMKTSSGAVVAAKHESSDDNDLVSDDDDDSSDDWDLEFYGSASSSDVTDASDGDDDDDDDDGYNFFNDDNARKQYRHRRRLRAAAAATATTTKSKKRLQSTQVSSPVRRRRHHLRSKSLGSADSLFTSVSSLARQSSTSLLPDGLSEMEKTLRQINAASSVAYCLRQGCARLAAVPPPPIELDLSGADAPSAPRRRLARGMFRCGTVMVTLFLRLLVMLSSCRALVRDALRPATVRSMSAFAADSARRLDQLARWPLMWQRARRWWSNKHRQRAYSMSLYNSVLLAIVDSCVGAALACVLITHVEQVIGAMERTWWFLTTDIVESLVRWLMGWPAGLKLNDDLDAFFARLCLGLLSSWSFAVECMAPLGGRVVIYTLAAVGVLGVSTQLALVADVVALSTLHVYALFSLASYATKLQLNTLKSLFFLFRGKKRNVLRQRVDSCDYDINQLLLGTLLFVVLAFLFPTTAAYALCFFLVRALVTSVQVALFLALEFIRHFPLFSLLVYTLDRNLLPRGISFSLLSASRPLAQSSSESSPPAYLELHSESLPITALFLDDLRSMLQRTYHLARTAIF
jgi:N-acetylglucosaminyl transferase component (Gpi1)